MSGKKSSEFVVKLLSDSSIGFSDSIVGIVEIVWILSSCLLDAVVC